MEDSTARHQLAKHKWKLYRREDMGLLPDGQLWRMIERVEHKDVHDLVQFLERFVDPANFDADSSVRYAMVSNPWADGRSREGTWRHLRTRIEKVDGQGRVGADGTHWRIVQELEEGFLTELSFDEARLLGVRATVGSTSEESVPVDARLSEQIFQLQWIGVDPDLMYSLVNDWAQPLAQTNVAYRKVQHDGSTVTVPITGDWFRLNAVGDLAPDGSGTVTVMYGNPTFTLEGFSNYNGAGQQSRVYWWNVPMSMAHIVVAAYDETGADVSASFDERSGLVDLIVDQLDFTKVDTGWKTYTSEDGTVGVRTVLNADGTTDLPGIITDLESKTSGNITNLSITPAFGMPGKFNVVASYRPSTSEYRISSGNWNSLSTRYYDFPARTLPNGMLRPRTAVKVSHHSTESNAWTSYGTAIGGNVSPALGSPILIESFGKWAAGIQYLGQNKWRAIRIEEETA